MLHTKEYCDFADDARYYICMRKTSIFIRITVIALRDYYFFPVSLEEQSLNQIIVYLIALLSVLYIFGN